MSVPYDHIHFPFSAVASSFLQSSLLHQCVCVRVRVSRQEFASRLHYHVVMEYVGQLMKGNYSCKNRKHEKAAAKIRHQWKELRAQFEDMVKKKKTRRKMTHSFIRMGRSCRFQLS